MRSAVICTAVAGLLVLPALAWADSSCCGGNAVISASPVVSTNGCNPCPTCVPCKPKCSLCRALFGGCKDECNACGACTVKTKVQCCHEKTKYKLVKTCEPVCHEKTVRVVDPCNPCVKTCAVVNKCHNRTRYHWVCVTEPRCHTKTVRVCSAGCNGMGVAFGGTVISNGTTTMTGTVISSETPTISGNVISNQPSSAFGGEKGTTENLSETEHN